MRRVDRCRRLASAAALAALAACGDSPAEPEAEALRVREIVLTDTAGAVVAYSHEDHWHGTLRLRPGETLPLRAYLSESEDSHDVPASRFTLEGRAEYALRVTVADPAVATWDGDRFALTVRARQVGSARTGFAVVRGAAVIFEAPRVLVVVNE